MADRHHPAPPQSTTADRTSALVAGGLALMAIVGVVTVFSDAIAAAWSPASPAATDPATASVSPTSAAQGAGTAGAGAAPAGASDGGTAQP
jgi:hypothetical protein